MKKIFLAGIMLILLGSLKLSAQTALDLRNVNTAIIQKSDSSPATNYTNLYTSWQHAGVEQGFLGYGSSSGNIYLYNNIGSLLLGVTNNTGAVTFHTNLLERMRLTPEGRFGIGTLNPLTTLDVNGLISAKAGLYIKTNGQNASEFTIEKPSGGYYSITAGHNELLFYNHSTQNIFMTFDANDNVGIGTRVTHNNKLAVAGNILAEKVKVKLQPNWPDYVFEPAYKLPSLQELEAYIKQHRHLPDVPSAKEVAEKGIDLGDTQAILLKKIEELTLIVIEQNKKLESQESRLKLLENKKAEL